MRTKGAVHFSPRDPSLKVGPDYPVSRRQMTIDNTVNSLVFLSKQLQGICLSHSVMHVNTSVHE